MAKLTPEKIIERAKIYESFYGNLHKIQKDDDDYYELVYKSGVPTQHNYQDIKPPTAREWVEVGIRNYTLDNPKSVVKPRGVSDAEVKRDGSIESFQNFWLERMIEDIKTATKNSLIRGEAFFSLWLDDTYLGAETPEEEQNRLYHFPIITDVPDPINVFPSPAHNGLIPVDVIESYKMTVAEALNLCELNKWKWKTDKKLTDAVTWIAYHDSEVRCFMLDKKPVLTPKIQVNILGFCPYVHIKSGLGHKSHEGKPEYESRSIIYPQRAMLMMQSRLLSQTDAMNARFAWRQAKIIGEEADVDALYGDNQIDVFNPNRPIRETERVKVEFVSGENVPGSIFQQQAMTAGMAQPPEVLSGMRPPGVYSAQGVDTLKASAKPRYKDPIKRMENGLSVVMDVGMRILHGYKHPVAIGEAVVGNARNVKQLAMSDLEGYRGCKVKLLAETPEATEMRKISGNNSQKAGVISHRTNLTLYHDMSKEEAAEEQARILAEKAIMQPGALEFAARDAAQRLGMEQVGETADEAGNKVSKSPPPRREPETLGPAYDQTRKRGRVTAGMEAQKTPGEEMAGRI